MAEDWKAPNADKVEVKYRIIQFASGEWAIEKSETACIAWFANRAQAITVCRSLLPLDAKREM